MMATILTVLVILASLSPLLTTAHLCQLKEWRWDRLMEHLRETGWRQLIGTTRPLVIVGMFLLFQFSIFPFEGMSPSGPNGNFQFVTLATLTLLNIIQILSKKQPYPVWTRKAIALVATSIFLTGIAAQFSIFNFQFSIIFLPLLQPFVLTITLAILSPLDFFLKRRVLHRATLLRSQFPHLTVIGITGSAGKTTTKELLAHILGPDRAIATPEHVNSELGIAHWLLGTLGIRNQELGTRTTPSPQSPVRGPEPLRAEWPVPSPRILVVEMGAYRQGEIATICSVVQPTMGIITNIGTQHIGLFGSQRAIAEAKGELFVALPPSGHAFVSVDTPFTQELRHKCQCPVTTVGTEGTPADVRATHVEEMPEGLRFHIHTTSFAIPLHGEHQLGNTLLAIAAAMELGIPTEEIAQRLQTFQPPQHTFAIRQEGGITILDDTHNASPESFRAAIEWARHQPHKPKILITPGIIEQGLSSARTHFQCGTLAKDIFDEAFILNKKFAHYFAQGLGKPVHHLTPKTYNLTPGALLTCIGRVPQNTIRKFLP